MIIVFTKWKEDKQISFCKFVSMCIGLFTQQQDVWTRALKTHKLEVSIDNRKDRATKLEL